jgi:MoaA/NifB/PqqE/SkfB family radical SAM enzyme
VEKPFQYFMYNVDITSQCNLRCPTCPNANFPEANHPQGNMSLELFSQILDKIELESPGQATYLCLYNWGEPFMHPELPEFVALARKRGMPAQISTNLNLNKNLEAVIRAEPQSLRISISGFKQESYQKTHWPGDVEKVKNNARLVREILDRYDSAVPVHFYYHKYRHNLGDELWQTKQFAENLGFEFKTTWANFAPIEKSLEYYQGVLPENEKLILKMICFTPEEARERALSLRKKYPDCILRQYQTTIDFDGSVVNCCGVYDRKNYVHSNFLDVTHAELQNRKYSSEMCQQCMKHGLDITGCYGVSGEFDVWLEERMKGVVQ